MADGDDGDDHDDDDDEGDDGEEGEDGDDDSRADDTRQDSLYPDDSEVQDRDMTDAMDITTAVEAPDAPEAPEAPVLDKMDTDPPEETASQTLTTSNLLTLAPPAVLASASPRIEGSPLKNVVLPSPTETRGPLGLLTEPAEQSDVENRLEDESMIAKPPSDIVGEAPDEALDRDIPHPELQPTLEKALLPPPPDQVGNISSPRASPKEEGTQPSEGIDALKEEVHPGEDALSGKPSMAYQNSMMTEDTIKPDDSASVEMAGSGAPSEIAAASVEDVVDAQSEMPAEPPAEVTVESTVEPATEEQQIPAPELQEALEKQEVSAEEEPDLMGGLLSELDRQTSRHASKSSNPETTNDQSQIPESIEKLAKESSRPPTETGEPLTELRSEPTPEPASESVQETPLAIAQETETQATPRAGSGATPDSVPQVALGTKAEEVPQPELLSAPVSEGTVLEVPVQLVAEPADEPTANAANVITDVSISLTTEEPITLSEEKRTATTPPALQSEDANKTPTPPGEDVIEESKET